MKKTLELGTSFILSFSSILIILITVLFSRKMLVSSASTKPINSENIQLFQNKNPIDINEILKENTSRKIEEEMVIEQIDLEYSTEYKNNNNLPKGTIQVIQEGRDGTQNAVIIKKYEDGELISEELVAENLIKSSINKIVEVGTGSGENNYNPKIGDIVYVTSNLLSVRLEPNKDSEKICTLSKNTEVKIQKIENEWLYISSKEQNGYIQSDCITNINPNVNDIEAIDGEEYSKKYLLGNLSFNMNLAKPSQFSLSQFKKVLEGQTSDKNNVFKENAEYFYYAEKQYGINGIFLAAVGIHESGWGTSKISLDKKNLFGYGANDSDPYGGAYNFNSYSEGIDLLARVFVKYYLNPKGSVIYDGNVANGKFYNGNTLSSVNMKYASDKNWANSVYKWITVLYNAL